MEYLFCKAFHMVGFVSWFAGLFYIVRIFIYHVESRERPEPARSVLNEEFTVMERRLWGLTRVAMVITFVFGIPLAVIYLKPQPSIFAQPWLLVKFGFLIVLLGYHHVCGRIRRQLAEGTCRWTSPRLRMWNEVATVLMVAIIMLAVFKSLFNALWGGAALMAFAIALGVAVRLLRGRWARTRPTP